MQNQTATTIILTYANDQQATINQTSPNGPQLIPDWRSPAGSKFDAPYDGPVNYQALFWVDRGPIIWLLQTSIAVICFLEAIMMHYLTYKVSLKLRYTLISNVSNSNLLY